MAKVAIITGATGGLGTEFIRVIHSYENIDEIWAVGRNTEKLNKLKEMYHKVICLQADFSEDAVEVLSCKMTEEQPDIRLLINNAGVGFLGPYENMEINAVKNFCRINCSSPAELISASLPYMQEGAGILNISSASSFQPNPYLALYSASKVFLKNLSRALSVELKPRNITVTAVCPGWIDTDMLPREKDGKKIQYTGMISAEKVVKQALKDLKNGKDISAPGFFSNYFRLYSKITPTRIVMKQWTTIIGKYV